MRCRRALTHTHTDSSQGYIPFFVLLVLGTLLGHFLGWPLARKWKQATLRRARGRGSQCAMWVSTGERLLILLVWSPDMDFAERICVLRHALLCS